MSATKNTSTLPAPYTGIKFNAYLSKTRLLNRKKLGTITKALRNINIGYQWGFPTKLMIKRQGGSHTIRSMKAGLALLRDWESS